MFTHSFYLRPLSCLFPSCLNLVPIASISQPAFFRAPLRSPLLHRLFSAFAANDIRLYSLTHLFSVFVGVCVFTVRIWLRLRHLALGHEASEQEINRHEANRYDS